MFRYRSIAGTHKHDIIERTQISLTSLSTLKKSIPVQPEAPQKSLRPRQTSIQRGESNSALTILLGSYFHLFQKNKRSKINFTKTIKADLDSPRQELSNGGLGIVIALMEFSWEFFCWLVLDVKSSFMLFGLTKGAWEAEILTSV